MEVDQQKSNSRDHSPVIQLLNQGDQLTQRFQKQFNDSITHVQTLNSSLQQHDNLSNLAARSGGMEINTQYPSVRQRTLATLTKTINEASGGIRSSLELMEATVDSLSELLYKVDIYLAEPASIGSIGFDPINALNHLGNLFTAYQAELLAKRELFFSFNCEEITIEEFVRQWQICNQIKSLTQETMDDLADVMGAWST
ncbi:hypothetical protein MJO28_007392 [Puccinia striiformis f. sp. tritici]|uniref:Uncharacterized protein n=3 Tax=Puccinia striiformis TaxID=27350 RepID=A0A0L0VVY0_9BASI|nr:hypothetical protein Pst134EA_013502 [Puccinia striiformis f. sp. tritici]KAI9613222.1 hypothetical protein KEM48_003854 [Puccinia striiformis f. sp. tritici PST-130]KNF03431.1 hypothetical protein, variant [Puccinia striiformis f. sp. tritici PST-78]POW10074.1 hypothetical protein PSTT_06337 [Puccinia striiformis]KAH9454405.1 hypothetical protein Pst134EB_014491 [Puccinia striiformis f. sp. tritici]KAH9465620.1 hypothetical protein Pst134EA_013502 [Puccinia striiformis f. sp. tritici]